MKKLFAVLLALAMLLAISVPALAENVTPATTSLTINNSDGRTYVGYQLLSLTTSLKKGEHHPTTCNGTDHSDDCYNYAYTVNEKYRAILQEETLANGRNELWVTNGIPANAAGVTDAQILEYLSYQKSDEGEGVYMTMRLVADRVYREIKKKNLEADEKALTGNNDTIEQGYWIIADTTNLTGNNTNSLVMVDTAGEENLEIKPKTALPTVEKKVKDIDDSEDDNIADNYWHDSADHDITDTVPFKLTATLPSNAQYYNSYKIVFHDTLSSGLTLNADSIRVYMYETKHKADVDTDVNDYVKDVTDVFVKTTEGLTDGCTFEVACENVFAIEGVTKDTAFLVYYTATLNAGAVIGAAGNPNEVYLEFSNNPYGDGTGTTEKDKVTVFTYKLVINKTDSHGYALEGAGFELYKKDYTGNYKLLGTELKGDGMTTFTWTGLDDGDYKLVEKTVPEGYNKMADITFSIAAVHSETDGEPKLISLDGGVIGTGEITTGAITKEIKNYTGTVLPETGAQGTFLLICGGAMLVIVAAVFMITRKKMSIFED